MGDAAEPDEVTKVLMNLMNNSVNLASTYVKHANRTQITPIDIKMALMADFIGWDLLKDNRPKPLLMEEGINMSLNVTEPFTPSVCDCIVCTEFNMIEIKLRSYTPRSQLALSVKEKLLESTTN
tara:strand:- start:997 stop:1368 length:372 start_codon:yes stop_codon:yes gene_type:complete